MTLEIGKKLEILKDLIEKQEFKTILSGKYDKNNADSLTKEGCFDKGGNLKPDRKEEFVTIINNIINYFDKE